MPLLRSALLFLLLATALRAQVPHDDVQGRALNHATFQHRPLAVSADGSTLYALNQPGSRLVLFAIPGLELVGEVSVGPGLVSVVERLPGQEVWLVDSVQRSVTIVDPTALSSRSGSRSPGVATRRT